MSPSLGSMYGSCTENLSVPALQVLFCTLWAQVTLFTLIQHVQLILFEGQICMPSVLQCQVEELFSSQPQYPSLYYILYSGERDTTTSRKAYSNIPIFVQTFTLIPSILIFLTVASVCTSSTGFGFIVLGRISAPQSDTMSFPIKRSSKGDKIPFHEVCLNIPIFIQTSTLILSIFAFLYSLNLIVACIRIYPTDFGTMSQSPRNIFSPPSILPTYVLRAVSLGTVV